MAELGELAAVLAASGNNSSQARTIQNFFNPQPNSMETGLALEATRNPIGALYYQAARNERLNSGATSPQALQAIQAAQQRDYEMRRLEALVGPLATIAGHDPAALPGVMGTLGVPLDEELFSLGQMLRVNTSQADAAQSLGSAGQSIAGAGGEFNDLFSQFGFDPIRHTTPTSVQSAAAGKSEPTYKGPKLDYSAYNGGLNINLSDVPPGAGMTLDDVRQTMGLNPVAVGDNIDNTEQVEVPPEVIERHMRNTARWGFTGQGAPQFNGYDDRNEPTFIQRVSRGGTPDVMITSRNSRGEWVTTLQSRGAALQ